MSKLLLFNVKLSNFEHKTEITTELLGNSNKSCKVRPLIRLFFTIPIKLNEIQEGKDF